MAIFPLSDDVFGIYLMFCAQFSFDLVTFDHLTLAVSDELRALHIKCTYQFLACYDYPFLSYVRLNLITLPLPGTVTAHAPSHVTYHQGQK